ncbi:quinoprotein relay system zinc metallohydrolase 2 [Silicimonas algicola]|uniref:Quinoprotein relay system zinc metallohydrolase 2 n=1 Tax=Silicimonas algicola TaxID=1826607 RepID=A0A316G2Q2_9RHOB|nr:quinoprotein relay system zinc metallohydrolase 2 [Silicimonas algicola]AZQ69106.1 quinoprotein relay system zinc metallohydrolase 2 [Silicimonas algicola]PWK55088.1 quinoprotein relay system zinc metallohydrolase 2 [Silicimonas algicola]
MFEAVVTLCLGLANAECADRLLPGYEAATLEGCDAALQARTPSIPGGADGSPRCVPSGPTLSILEVAPGVFVHVGLIEEPSPGNDGDVSNSGFVVGRDSVAVIDAGGSRLAGEGLWRAVRAETDLPVSHVLLTHMHPDHIFGASVFTEAGAEVVGHADLPRALADRASTYVTSFERLVGSSFAGSAIPKVSVTIADPTEIDLGDRTLIVEPWPVAHTGTDMTVFDRATGVMFLGDLLFDEHTPSLDGSLKGWKGVLTDLTFRELEVVVPGHGAASLDWPEGAANLERYLSVLESDTRDAIERGDRIGDAIQTIAADEATRWSLFDAYNPRNATVAWTELEWE